MRTNSSLKKQAEFINRLKDGDIWSHVIIIVKQSVNPKYDARGALAAMQVGDVTKAKAQFWITSIDIYYYYSTYSTYLAISKDIINALI